MVRSSLVVVAFLLAAMAFGPSSSVVNKQKFLASGIPSVRIDKFEAFDKGTYGDDSEGDLVIDISRRTCVEDDPTTSVNEQVLESFYDTVMGVEVYNGVNTSIKFSSMYFRVTTPTGTVRSFQSKSYSPLRTGIVKPGTSKKLYGFFLQARTSDKIIPGRSSPSTLEVGFKNVRAYLKGRSSSGRRYTIRALSTFSFNDVNNCS